MPTPEQINDAIKNVHDQETFIQELLAGALGWPFPEDVFELEDAAYEWTPEELRAGELDNVDNVWQIQPFNENQPWGIFVIEMNDTEPFIAGRGMAGVLRRILRGLTASRMRPPHLPSWDASNLLFILTYKYRHFRFAYFKKPEGRQKSRPLAHFGWIDNETYIRTLCEYNLFALVYPKDDENAEVWAFQWAQAFDVERVTDRFFKDYRAAAFDPLRKHLLKHSADEEWSHKYALQFLNRVMFLYFVQGKRWLGDDKKFLRTLWKTYSDNGRPEDSFVVEWLEVLFFEAFNNRFSAASHPYLPAQIREVMKQAPFLNGGLFKGNEHDQKKQEYSVTIPDRLFRRVLSFFERCNFTIAEDTPFDVEVAVDPEMIGRIYESLVNISDLSNERSDAGIFYTPRTEIDLMCRLSLVNYLNQNLPDTKKGVIYEIIFAHDDADKDEADLQASLDEKFWPAADKALREVTIVDPACGSGSFLVGMLSILADLRQRAARRLSTIPLPVYELKKDIIGANLYGVDVKDWAVHVAELRLWLQLVVDTEEKPEDDQVPLLPDLTFKIRTGDSLVEELGGHVLSIRSDAKNLPSRARADIEDINQLKIMHYKAATDTSAVADDIRRRRIMLFQALIKDLSDKVQTEIEIKQVKLNSITNQRSFTGEENKKQRQNRIRIETEIRDLKGRRGELALLNQSVQAGEFNRFFWELDFPEVFSHRNGFDIVIGNPPYVRQEEIADPSLPEEEARRTSAKKEYKAKLQNSVLTHFEDRVPAKLNAKADLYIYFYFHGLSLLNSKGTFCFITSNSWLDVAFGKDLQEFLLRNCCIKLIIDNKSKRSFASADVNTVISVFSAPVESRDAALEHRARFVMFQVPFDQLNHPAIFEEIEEASERESLPEYRVIVKKQIDLLADGSEMEIGAGGARKLIQVSKYVGNKWGGKYLRAPDIYWTLLKKGAGKLVKLGDIADVRFGIKTGANEFFYLSEADVRLWGIEEEFLKPVIKSPRECKSIVINPDVLQNQLFMCHKKKHELKGTAALEYIKWGEKREFHRRPSCRGRKRWWDLGKRRIPPLVCPSSVSQLFRVFHNEQVYVDKRLYEIYSEYKCFAVLNSTLSSLFLETGSRTGLGEGLLDMTVYEVSDCLVLRTDSVGEDIDDHITSMIRRPLQPFDEELTMEDRKALDDICFDALELTRGERDAVYEAVNDLVSSRLKKADSVDVRKKLRNILKEEDDLFSLM